MNINIAHLFDSIISWGLVSAPRILGILVVTILLNSFGAVFIERFIRRIIVRDRGMTADAEAKRENTLIRILNASFGVTIWLLALLIILQEFGVDVGPIIAAVGVAGIALGFGGQYLIRDLISGLFIIMENQYRIGDVVCLDSTCGLVEDISLRMTTLRDVDGVVHHVPHGDIKRVSNKSKDFSRVNLNVGVSYSVDLEKVIKIVDKVGADLAKDPEWQALIIKAPKFLRVQEFADSAVIIKILGETQPAQQLAVTGELRRRLKMAFDKAGIEIPYPQRVVHTVKH